MTELKARKESGVREGGRMQEGESMFFLRPGCFLHFFVLYLSCVASPVSTNVSAHSCFCEQPVCECVCVCLCNAMGTVVGHILSCLARKGGK